MDFYEKANVGQSLKVNDQLIEYEHYGKKELIRISDVEKCLITNYSQDETSILKLQLKNERVINIQILNKQNSFQALVKELNSKISLNIENSYDFTKEILFINRNNRLIYLGGYPGLPASKDLLLDQIDRNHIRFSSFDADYTIPYHSILSYRMETKKELESRVNLFGFMVFGIYALAFPTIDITYEKFLVLNISVEEGEFALVFGGPAVKEVNQIIFNDFKQHSGNNLKSVKNALFDELKELKELLDLGIITQEEFDLKKKVLLEL